VEAVVNVNIDCAVQVGGGYRHDAVTPHLSLTTHLHSTAQHSTHISIDQSVSPPAPVHQSVCQSVGHFVVSHLNTPSRPAKLNKADCNVHWQRQCTCGGWLFRGPRAPHPVHEASASLPPPHLLVAEASKLLQQGALCSGLHSLDKCASNGHVLHLQQTQGVLSSQ